MSWHRWNSTISFSTCRNVNDVSNKCRQCSKRQRRRNHVREINKNNLITSICVRNSIKSLTRERNGNASKDFCLHFALICSAFTNSSFFFRYAHPVAFFHSFSSDTIIMLFEAVRESNGKWQRKIQFHLCVGYRLHRHRRHHPTMSPMEKVTLLNSNLTFQWFDVEY